MAWVTRGALSSWDTWNSGVSGRTLLPRSANGTLRAWNSLGAMVSLLPWGTWFSRRTHVAFGTWCSVTPSHTRASQGAREASWANQTSGTWLSSLASGPWRSLYALFTILSWGTRLPYTSKITPLALLTRQPWQAIKAPVTLRSCVSWETPSSICSSSACLAFPAGRPRRALQSSGTLWPYFSQFTFQTWISRKAHRARAPGEPHWTRGPFHGELSLLQHRLGLGLLEGDWGSFHRAAS